jgi:hypothetical protein
MGGGQDRAILGPQENGHARASRTNFFSLCTA